MLVTDDESQSKFQSGRVSRGYSQLLVHESHGASKLGLQCRIHQCQRLTK